jgi:hypothetical protein
MKTIGKHRTRIEIVSDGVPMSSEDYTKIRRVVSMLENNDFDVTLKGFVSEDNFNLKQAV